MHDRPDDSDAPLAALDDDPRGAVDLLDDLDADRRDDGGPDAAATPPFRRWWGRLDDKSGMDLAAVGVDVVIVVGAVLFVLASLHPEKLIANTTPAGGDMGAHVWGPAYLRDHLLPSFRLSGWTPDWYAGFPAYQFYMVVPALAIVALDAGFNGWSALLPAAIAAGLLYVAGTHERQVVRRSAFVVGLAVAILGIGLPYGVAFKFIAVSGLLALPVCCYVAGRLADLPFPGPVLLSVASIIFLFNRQPTLNGTGNIIGGNVASTLAGEFSFSISLAFCVLYIGFLLRGLRTGQYRKTAAVLLAFTVCCHIIPAIYAGVATGVALLVSMPLGWKRIKWFLPIAPIAVALTAFWTGPFALRRAYLNDMGWEKLPGPCRTEDCARIGHDYLWPHAISWLLALALVGAVVSVLLRIRLGVLLTLCTLATGVLFVVAPEGRLWNARLLPFYYLCLALLAGLAVSELARAVAALVAKRPERSVSFVTLLAPVGGALAIYVLIGLPLGILPGAHATADGGVAWGLVSVAPGDKLVVRSWAEWNFRGYEQKAAYPEYYDLISMAQTIGDDPGLGCGRVMWEYDNDRLNRYGTPMAPMLLPFWTDGCMGSMEGLFFEASSTTPYHFLNQRALSTNCSCAQRDLPYGSGFDIQLGIEQLQTMGVRYYFAFTDPAVAAAAADPDLTEVGHTDVWHAYLVADSALVSPLEYQPVVLEGLHPGMDWVGPASKWWEDVSRMDVPLAADGPAEWQRVPVCDARTAGSQAKSGGLAGAGDEDAAEEFPNRSWTYLDVCEGQIRDVALPANEVSAISTDTDGISFDVTTPGVPVVVKASYFPNWQVSGADGPYRLTPNLMVVVPTGNHVELTYGWTPVDLGSYFVTFLGILALIGLSFLRTPEPGRVWLDGPDPIVPARRYVPADDETDLDPGFTGAVPDDTGSGTAARPIADLDDDDLDDFPVPWGPDDPGDDWSTGSLADRDG